MKIQLVTDQPSAPLQPRTPFSACPLCEGQSVLDVREIDVSGQAGLAPELESSWNWKGCATCGHLFTEGHFDAATLAALHGRPALPRCLEPEYSALRQQAADVVHRVSELRSAIEGLWLDVGCGSGTLLTTAHEFGYETLGIDLRQVHVDNLRADDYLAECVSIEGIEGQGLFDVISFCDTLEALPYPGQALQAAQRLLRPGGVLFLSGANVDSHAWRQLDAENSNPYWTDPERFHNFSREHLYWLLRRSGFEPCDYGVSPSLPAGMEVCARKQSDLS